MQARNGIKKTLAAVLLVLAVATVTRAETINLDFGYATNYWLQADGWNRASLDSVNWGIGHAYTPWTNNLINSEGNLTSVRLQVLQRATTWRVNTYPNGLAGDALALFGTPAAGAVANLYNETADCKLQFLGLDTNKIYKFTILCSRMATGVGTNGFILNKGHSTSNSVLDILPYGNNSEVSWQTNRPYKATFYAGALGNITENIIKFDFLRVGTVGVGALNGLIIEEVAPPPPPPPGGTIILVQ